MFNAAKSALFKEILEVTNGMHNDTWFKGGADYNLGIKRFMERANSESRE